MLWVLINKKNIFFGGAKKNGIIFAYKIDYYGILAGDERVHIAGFSEFERQSERKIIYWFINDKNKIRKINYNIYKRILNIN